MITKQDLQEAIAECLGQKNPNANTCMKLAAYYTIMGNLYPDETEPVFDKYSFAPEPLTVGKIGYTGDTEFAKAITGQKPDDVWQIMDELMDAVSVLEPRLYRNVLDRIEEL